MIFSKPKQEMPVMQGSYETRAAWWSLFTDLIRFNIDDGEDLERTARNIRQVVEHSRMICDAVIEAYDERWRGLP